ncbi:cytochrome p450 4g44, partial [Lasius niger]
MDAISTILYSPNIPYSLLALLIVTLIALYYYVETSRTVCLVKKLPGPPHIPILGHALITFRMSPESVLPTAMEYYEKYGSVAGVYFGTRVIVFLADPQDIEIILSNPAHNDKAVEYEYFQPWLGDGLLITTGDKWRRHRKIIAPTFHMSILKTFVPLFYENSMDLVKRLRDEVGKEFDCHDYLSAVTVDILTETAMGVKREKRQKTGYDYAVAVMKMSDILHRRHYDISLRPDIIFKFTKFAKKQEKLLNIIHTLTNGVIREKSKDIEEKDQQQKEVQNSKPMESLNATKNEEIDKNATKYTKLHYVRDDLDDIDENDVSEKKRLAFLHTMLDLKKNGGQMTDEEIWEEVNTIMFE